MTRQVVPWCTSGLLPLNAPLLGAQGTPLQTQPVRSILTMVCANRQHCAGRGIGPYALNDTACTRALDERPYGV